MDGAFLMGSLALDLGGWYHAGETHKTIHTCTRTHTNRTDTVKLDIALGLIMNTRTAKYLTPRLSVNAAKIHKPTR